MSTQQRLIEILAKSGSSIELTESDLAKTFTDLGLDSLDVYAFFTEIEIELGVKIEDNDIPDMLSMDQVCEYVSSRIA